MIQTTAYLKQLQPVEVGNLHVGSQGADADVEDAVGCERIRVAREGLEVVALARRDVAVHVGLARAACHGCSLHGHSLFDFEVNRKVEGDGDVSFAEDTSC